jgi:hypothetical protein
MKSKKCPSGILWSKHKLIDGVKIGERLLKDGSIAACMHAKGPIAVYIPDMEHAHVAKGNRKGRS